MSKISPHSQNEVPIFFENKSRLFYNCQDSRQQGKLGKIVL